MKLSEPRNGESMVDAAGTGIQDRVVNGGLLGQRVYPFLFLLPSVLRLSEDRILGLGVGVWACKRTHPSGFGFWAVSE